METARWYERKGIVLFWIVVFFPVGLYGLFKSHAFTVTVKIAVVVLLLIAFLGIATLDRPQKQQGQADRRERMEENGQLR